MRLKQYSVLALFVTLAIGIPACTETRSYAVEYLNLIEQGIEQSRQDLPAIEAAAEDASKVILAGGNMWAGGSQAKFFLEAEERAGGFMAIHNVEGREVKSGDLIVYGAAGTLDEDDAKQIQAWRELGAHVVAFAIRGGEHDDAPNTLIGQERPAGLNITIEGEGKLIPTDTTLNAVNLWVWTAEVVSACTRAGKMPILYKSYGLEGGEERAKHYREKGGTFHDDMQIVPIERGKLGADYLDNVAAIVRGLKEQLPDIRKAAIWWRDTPTEHVLLAQMGHMFPEHYQDERAPLRFSKTWWANYNETIDEPDPAHLVLWMGYQRAPNNLIQQVQETGMRLVYASVKSGEPAEPSNRIIYINPGWPITDAMLEIPGYDVNICPGSGVTNAIIYWTILAESYSPLVQS